MANTNIFKLPGIFCPKVKNVHKFLMIIYYYGLKSDLIIF
jgi:hypothetical protein